MIYFLGLYDDTDRQTGFGGLAVIYRSCGSVRNQRTNGGSRWDNQRAAGFLTSSQQRRGEGRTVQRVERTRLEEFESYLTVERGKRKKPGNVCGSVRKPVGWEERVWTRERRKRWFQNTPSAARNSLDNFGQLDQLSETFVALFFFFAPKSCGAHKSWRATTTAAEENSSSSTSETRKLLLTLVFERGIENCFDHIFSTPTLQESPKFAPLLRCGDGARQGCDDGCSHHEAQTNLQLGNADLDLRRLLLLLEVCSRQLAHR